MPSEELNFPQIANLGIYRGACQCQCVHCPVGITDMPMRRETYGSSEIGLKVFELFCNEIKDYKTTVRLHAVGEPTLHSKFVELLRTIRRLDLQHKFWIFTNGLFRPGLIPELVESIGIIEVSINSTNRDDYRQTKGVDRYTAVLDNVYKMRERIKRLGLATRIVLTKVQSSEAKDQEFIKYWSARSFECFVRSFHNYSGILQTSQNTAQVVLNTPKCLVPWKRFNLDGTMAKELLVAVNCFNVLFQNPTKINSNSVMGQFPDVNLSGIWSGIALCKIRSELELGLPTMTDCDRCTEWLTNVGPRAENVISKEEGRR